MKFGGGEVIEYNQRNVFFFKNHAQIEVARLVPGLFLFFKKMLYEVTAKDLRLSFGIF